MASSIYYSKYIKAPIGLPGRASESVIPAYVGNVVQNMTRTHPSLQLGVSTRGAIALIRGAQACALLNERDYNPIQL